MTGSSVDPPLRGFSIRPNQAPAARTVNSRNAMNIQPRVTQKNPVAKPATKPWRIMAATHRGIQANIQLISGATKIAANRLRHPRNTPRTTLTATPVHTSPVGEPQRASWRNNTMAMAIAHSTMGRETVPPERSRIWTKTVLTPLT